MQKLRLSLMMLLQYIMYAIAGFMLLFREDGDLPDIAEFAEKQE